MPEAFIYDHVRTPRGKGKKDGALHEVTALRWRRALKALKERNGLDTKTCRRRDPRLRRSGRRAGSTSRASPR